MDIVDNNIASMVHRIQAADRTIAELRAKLAKAEHDRDRYRRRVEQLQAENVAMRKQISEMIMPPCTIAETIYITSFYFGDGYDEAGNATHTSGWQISETKVDEKNFYKMCDFVRNGKAFFSREAAEARLEELKYKKEGAE